MLQDILLQDVLFQYLFLMLKKAYNNYYYYDKFTKSGLMPTQQKHKKDKMYKKTYFFRHWLESSFRLRSDQMHQTKNLPAQNICSPQNRRSRFQFRQKMALYSSSKSHPNGLGYLLGFNTGEPQR